MLSLPLILILIAIALFVAAGVGVATRFNLGWIGLAFFAAAFAAPYA